MAVAYVQHAVASGASVSSVNVSKPTGTSDGHFMLAVVGIATGTDTITPPAGWTAMFPAGRMHTTVSGHTAIFWKFASGEGSSYTFTIGSTNAAVTGAIITYSGVHTTDPIATWMANVSSIALPPFPAVMDAYGNSMILGIVTAEGLVGGTINPPSGYTERLDHTTHLTCYIAEKVNGAAGLVPAIAPASGGGSGGVDRHMFHILLRDAAVADPTDPTLRGFILQDAATTTQPVRVPPANTGDVMVVTLARASGSDFTVSGVPSGWTLESSLFSNGIRFYTYKRTAAALEPSTVYTWTVSSAVWFVFSAVVTSTTGISDSVEAAGVSSSPTSASATALSSGALLLHLFDHVLNNPITPPGGTIERWDSNLGMIDSEGDLNSRVGVFHESVGAGATGTRTFTVAGSGNYMIGSLVFEPENRAPYAPTLVSPADAATVFFTTGGTIDWTFSDVDAGDTQSAFAIRRKVGAGSYTYYNVAAGTWDASIVWNTSTTSEYTFPSGKWTGGTTYSWSVATKDAAGLAGPFATDRSMVVDTPPVVTVTGPASPVTNDSTPPVTWTFTDAESNTQQAYQVKIESGSYGTTPGSGTTKVDSGEVVTTTQSYTPTVEMVNGTTYRAFVRLKMNNGAYSDWAYTTFTMSLTPPGAPTLTVQPDAGRVRLNVTGTHATASFPTTTFRVEYSDDGGTTWRTVRGAGALPGSGTPGPTTQTVYDYEAPAHSLRQYRAFTIASGI